MWNWCYFGVFWHCTCVCVCACVMCLWLNVTQQKLCLFTFVPMFTFVSRVAQLFWKLCRKTAIYLKQIIQFKRYKRFVHGEKKAMCSGLILNVRIWINLGRKMSKFSIEEYLRQQREEFVCIFDYWPWLFWSLWMVKRTFSFFFAIRSEHWSNG